MNKHKIEVVDKNGNHIEYVNTIVEVCKKYNVNPKTVTAHCKGECKYIIGSYILDIVPY
jgi:hypothetical protein